MKILIIGGTGFIGRHLVTELADRHELTLLHRGNHPIPDRHRSILLDRRSLPDHRAAFAEWKPDVVIDLIAYFAQDAWDLVYTFRDIGPRLILISSGDVYRSYEVFRGEPGPLDNLPARETAELRHRLFPYRDMDRENYRSEHYDKILVELILQAQADLDYTLLRLGAVYGPHDGQQKLGEYLLPMLRGDDQLVLDPQKATWRWTRVYVEEVARAIRFAVENATAARRETFNVGEATSLTERELAAHLQALTGWKGKLVLRPGNNPEGYNYAQHVTLNTGKIRKELAYAERYTREEGWLATIEYLQNNG